jgi:hypothetical protein
LAATRRHVTFTSSGLLCPHAAWSVNFDGTLVTAWSRNTSTYRASSCRLKPTIHQDFSTLRAGTLCCSILSPRGFGRSRLVTEISHDGAA